MTREEKNGFSYRIMQASPTEITIILYEMAEVYIKDALDANEGGSETEFRNSIRYARAVLNELNHSLNLEYEISLNFMQIYLFINRALLKASITGTVADLDRCVKMLDKLRDAFERIKTQDRRGPVMKNTQQVYAGLTYGKGTLNESFGLESNRGFRV